MPVVSRRRDFWKIQYRFYKDRRREEGVKEPVSVLVGVDANFALTHIAISEPPIYVYSRRLYIGRGISIFVLTPPSRVIRGKHSRLLLLP